MVEGMNTRRRGKAAPVDERRRAAFGQLCSMHAEGLARDELRREFNIGDGRDAVPIWKLALEARAKERGGS